MTARAGGWLLTVMGALLAIGLAGAGRAAAAPNAQVPTDPASLARGQEIYAQMCAMCHGLQGRGDGPLARTMVPRPADFRVHMAEGHTPEQLFDWTSNGVPDTAMQGFANDLSVEDRWNVIGYLQTFAPAEQ
ncbi:MAG TPA: cytochrome c [Chloroflexota bacterium]|nr:cytochrome c [Chloroflexota bacterium]